VPPTALRQRTEEIRRACKQVQQQYRHWLHRECHSGSHDDIDWYLWVIYHNRRVQQQALNAGSESILRQALEQAIARESWEFDPPMRLALLRYTNMDDIEEAGGMMMFFR